LQKGSKEEPDAAADQAEQQELHEEGREDAAPLQTEGPQGADLSRAVGDGGIHGDHGADHGTQGKDHRQRHAEDTENLAIISD